MNCDKGNSRVLVLALLMPLGLARGAADQAAVNVRAWGYGYHGQLGSDSDLPLVVNNLTGIVDAAAGSAHTLARKSDGTVWAWGSNSRGQLGDGTSVRNSPVPVLVSNLAGAVALAAAREHNLAVKRDGAVWAWGSNGSGELGTGTNADSSVPIRVKNLTGIVAVAAGAGFSWDVDISHSLALKNDGTVWAWGYNYYGQLGNGRNIDSNVPVRVSNLTSVVAITAGSGHSLALRRDGTVWGWGDNYEGQIGGYDSTNIPVQVSNLTGVVAIAAGNEHSMALKADGTVWVWGSNWYGQLGNATNELESHVPIKMPDLAGIVAIAAGDDHSLVLKNDSKVLIWPLQKSLAPVEVNGLRDVMAISGGGQHSVAVKKDATVVAWGENAECQLATLSVGKLTGVMAVNGADYHNLALKTDGTVWGWGSNFAALGKNGKYPYTAAPVAISKLQGIAAIAGYSRHHLALKNDGTVWAWGWNAYGQLGDGTTTDSRVPITVRNLTDVVGIAAGYSFSVALRADGTVYEWGGRKRKQYPEQVHNLTSVVAIAAAGYYEHGNYALRSDGTVWAWGYNNSGPSVAQPFHGLADVVAIEAGLALKRDGTVWAWGSNDSGQLGDGTFNDSREPVKVSNLTEVIAIAVGQYHRLALKRDGTVWAWGSNYYGQLSYGIREDRSNVPVLVPYLDAPVVGIAGGGSDSLAVVAKGIPVVTLSSRTLDFGNQPVGTASSSQSITITNSGSVPLLIRDIRRVGGNQGDFSRTGDTCSGATLAAGSTCELTIQFAPTTPGSRSGAFLVNANGANNPRLILLSGVGTSRVP